MTDYDTYQKEFRWELDFSLNLGDADRKFFEGLQEKRILGKKHTDSGRVFVPPQPYDDRTFTATDEWVEMEQKGVIESYTVTFRQFRNMPEPPYVNGAIRIGDSETCLLHFIGGLDADDPEAMIEEISSGMTVEPVWSDERDGDILDIKHFEPVE
jgi:uncharacterized OB-fold protein